MLYQCTVTGKVKKMGNMKKVLSFLLTSALVLSSFAGCASSGTSSGGKSDSEPVTLTIWGDSANEALLKSSFTAINDAFTKKYPNIKLNYQYSGSSETLQIAMQSNSLPDLFWVYGNKTNVMAQMVGNGQLLNLSKYNIDTSRFPKESVDYATVNGGIYCSFPSFFDYAIMYYNKDIFSKYNLSIPKTWSDFENIVSTLNKNGVTPIAFGGKGEFDRYWLMQYIAPALCNDTMDALANKKSDADYAKMAKAFDVYRDFAQKGYLGKNYMGIDGTGAQLAFTTGKAAMTVDGTWNSQVYSKTTFKTGSFAAPGEDGKRYAQVGPSNYNTYAVSSKTKHPDEAAKYVEFLNSKEAEQILEDNLGSVPLVKDLTLKNDSVKELAAYDVVGYNIYNMFASLGDDNSKPQDVLLGKVLPNLMEFNTTGEQGVNEIKAEMAKKGGSSSSK